MHALGDRPTWGGYILQHLLVFLFCVAFPGITTLAAPATWLTFKREHGEVQCTTRTCMFFIVPFKVQRIDPVTAISQQQRAGKTERQRKHGRNTNKYVHVDGEGFLRIHGVEEKYIEVSVSPASITSVATKAESFLKSNDESSTTLFAIANWKFGGLMGGVLSLLTLLCVVGYSLNAIKLLAKFVTRIFRRLTNNSATSTTRSHRCLSE